MSAGIAERSKIDTWNPCPNHVANNLGRSLGVWPVTSGQYPSGANKKWYLWSRRRDRTPSKNPRIPFALLFRKGSPPPGAAGGYIFDFNEDGSPSSINSKSVSLSLRNVIRSKLSRSNQSCLIEKGIGLSAVIASSRSPTMLDAQARFMSNTFPRI